MVSSLSDTVLRCYDSSEVPNLTRSLFAETAKVAGTARLVLHAAAFGCGSLPLSLEGVHNGVL